MTREERRTKLLRHLKFNRNVGADYLITDEDVDEIIEALEQRTKEKWIPVSKRMPKAQKNGDKDFSDWLQVTIDIGRNGDSEVYVCEAYYCFSENKWYTKRFVVGVVTAWMSLPEPYSESEDNE